MSFRPFVPAAALTLAAACAAADAPVPAQSIVTGPDAVDSTPAGEPIAIEREAIHYSVGPCRGTCPVYTVTVGADGRGTFVGHRHVAVPGTSEFTIDPAAYRRFAGHLAPIRPQTGDIRYTASMAHCAPAATDGLTIVVRWSSDSGAADQHLSHYSGCRHPQAIAVVERLRGALDLLPIGDFIRKR